jgi:hypothetical protein
MKIKQIMFGLGLICLACNAMANPPATQIPGQKGSPLSHEARIHLEEKNDGGALEQPAQAPSGAISKNEVEELQRIAPAAGPDSKPQADPLLDIRPLLEQ